VTRGPQFSHGIKVTPGDVVVASATNVRKWVTMATSSGEYPLRVSGDMSRTVRIMRRSPSSGELRNGKRLVGRSSIAKEGISGQLWYKSVVMPARSTNQVDMSVFPGVEEYPLRLPRRHVKDSVTANNHRIGHSKFL
jgi:hypothetical protein